jgi:hypothetical protein
MADENETYQKRSDPPTLSLLWAAHIGTFLLADNKPLYRLPFVATIISIECKAIAKEM